MAKRSTIKVRQTGSAMRRRFDQRQNLIGLGLTRIGRVAEILARREDQTAEA